MIIFDNFTYGSNIFFVKLWGQLKKHIIHVPEQLACTVTIMSMKGQDLDQAIKLKLPYEYLQPDVNTMDVHVIQIQSKRHISPDIR